MKRTTRPAWARRLLALLVTLSSAVTLSSSARAEAPLDAARAARAEVERVEAEVKAADPYHGGGRWQGGLDHVRQRLERSEEGGERRFRWFGEAVAQFVNLPDRTAGLRVLRDLGRRLALLEEALARPRQEPDQGTVGRPRPSNEEIKRLLRRQGPGREDEARPKGKPKEGAGEGKQREVRRDDPEPAAGGGRPRSGVIAPQGDGGFGTLGWFLLAGLALAVLVVAAVRFFSSRQERPARPRPEAASPEAGPVDSEPPPHEQSAEALWRRAEELARAGDFRLAMRTLYLAVLSRLHHQHLLSYEPTRTNGEYVRQVRLADGAPPDLYVPFEQLTTLFEARWYGEGACAAGDYAACRALAEEIQSRARLR
jgi:hypothetical protein